jgi:hypothetical protein
MKQFCATGSEEDKKMGVRLQVQTPTKTQKRFRRTPTIKAKNKQ